MTIPIETANVINFQDLEVLIEETYDRYASIPEAFESHNNSFLFYTALKQSESSVEKYIQEWADWEEHWLNLEAIFIDLANKDLIPEGKYYILVSW